MRKLGIFFLAKYGDIYVLLNFDICLGNEDGVFAIDYITGDVVAVKPVDYESSAGSYSLKIAATDRPVHEQSRSTTAEVLLNPIRF